MQKKAGTTPQQQKQSNPRGTTRRRKAGTRRVTHRTVHEEEDAGGETGAVTVDVEEQTDANRARKPAEIAMENFGLSVARKQIEGLKAEFKEIQSYQPADQSAVSFQANKDKNRYNNVLCYDRTRVVLTFNVPPDSDYIHANWINPTVVTLNNKYICTQGPMNSSVNDFWRMIYQEKVRHITMLCGVIENGKPKCAQYYPERVEESKTYGNVIVTNKRSLTAPNEKIFESIQLQVGVEGKDSFELKLMRWLDWPDFSIPNSGMGMLRILKTIRDCKGSTAVVHCSAGVGRTGTIVGTELCLKILMEGKALNVPEVIKELRSQRAGSIQTESQYIYMHRALCEYIHAKKLCKDELAAFFKSFVAYRQSLIKPAASPTPNAQQAAPQVVAPLQPTPQQGTTSQKMPPNQQVPRSNRAANQSAYGLIGQVKPK